MDRVGAGCLRKALGWVVAPIHAREVERVEVAAVWGNHIRDLVPKPKHAPELACEGTSSDGQSFAPLVAVPHPKATTGVSLLKRDHVGTVVIVPERATVVLVRDRFRVGAASHERMPLKLSGIPSWD